MSTNNLASTCKILCKSFQSPKSLVSFVDVKDLIVSVSNLIHNCEVVVVSKMSGFDMNAVKPIVMTDFVSPSFFNDRILVFGLNMRMYNDLFLNVVPMVVVITFNDNDLVSHFFEIDNIFVIRLSQDSDLNVSILIRLKYQSVNFDQNSQTRQYMKKLIKNNGGLDIFKDYSFTNNSHQNQQVNTDILSSMRQISTENKIAQSQSNKSKKVKYFIQSQAQSHAADRLQLEKMRGYLLQLYQQHQKTSKIYQNMKTKIDQFPQIKRQNLQLEAQIMKIKQKVKKALLQRQKKKVISKKVNINYQK